MRTKELLELTFFVFLTLALLVLAFITGTSLDRAIIEGRDRQLQEQVDTINIRMNQ